MYWNDRENQEALQNPYDWAGFYQERLRLVLESIAHAKDSIREAEEATEVLKRTHLYRLLRVYEKLTRKKDYTEIYLKNRKLWLQSDGLKLEEIQLQIDHPKEYSYDARKAEVAEAFREAAETDHEWTAFEREDFRLQNSYYAWQLQQRAMRDAEPAPERTYRYRTFDREKLPERWAEIAAQAAVPEADFDFLVVATMHGRTADGFERRLDAFLNAHPGCALLYADEDLLYTREKTDAPSIEGRFRDPWFKPEWSPETLMSYLYFGNFIVFSRKLLCALHPEPGQEGLPFVYDLCLQAAEALERAEGAEAGAGIGHIPEVLFHMVHYEGDPYSATVPGADVSCKAVRERAIARRGLAARLVRAQEQRYFAAEYKLPEGTLISAVILSKDHPHVLEKCVSSFRERTLYPNYELIVVDNGSDAQNRAEYEALAEKYAFRYFYEPQEFNFSAMCNRGYREAKGELILLLNDDTEILQRDWLHRMGGLALQPRIGCVGAKLIYAGTELIQHAGVAMLEYGPSHKLVEHPDGENFYHGANRVTREVMCVTAACLMFERKKMEEIGLAASGSFPMDESYKVAYNDVELCLRFADAGYRNVLCNDAVLYHYESLSRGEDAMSAEKWVRLAREQERLFGQYPRYRKWDPYYSPNLTVNATAYDINYYYPWKTVDQVTRLARLSAEDARGTIGGDRIKMNVEGALLHPAPYPGAEDTYTVTGWAYIPGIEAPLAEKQIVLQRADEPEGELWIAGASHMRREDVDAMRPDQNLLLSGFFVRLCEEDLRLGEYRVGVRLKVGEEFTGICWSGKRLMVEDRSAWKYRGGDAG